MNDHRRTEQSREGASTGRTLSVCVLGGMLTLSGASWAESLPPAQADPALSFDGDFLGIGGAGPANPVDLTWFAHRGGMAPGRYVVQVQVNGKTVDEARPVTFNGMPGRPGQVYACVNAREMAQWWGILATAPDGTRRAGQPAGAPQDEGSIETCPVGGVTAMVPYAQETFDVNRRLLILTVPQAALGPASRLRTPPQRWDEGMVAVLMNYTLSGSRQTHDGVPMGSDFLGLNTQTNLAGWRVRDDLTWHQRQGAAAELSASGVSAQRDFARWGGGLLTLGQTSPSGLGGGAVQFTGVKVDSDAGMLDPAFTTWRPAITGIALSPATVTVRQYGKVIYQQNVPQGPFALTEFNRSGNGDVDVEIREADGSTRRLTLAQTQNGNLLLRGGLTYSVSAGTATHSAGYADNRFVQAGASYGAWANATLTAGALLSRDYQALSVGTSVYAGVWGALSYALNTARADLSAVPGRDAVDTGVNQTVSGSRNLGDTAVGVAWSHSQSRAYHTYAGVLAMAPGEDRDTLPGTRDSISLSLSRALGPWGSLSLSGSRTTRWNSDEVQRALSLGYALTVEGIGIGVSLGLSTLTGREGDTGQRVTPRTDRSVAVNVSLPLGDWLYAGNVNGTYSTTRSNGTVGQQAGLSGSALDGALSWSASQTLGDMKNGNASLGYTGPYGMVNGGVNYGAGGHGLSYGATGGLAFHRDGVTAGRPLAFSGGNALVAIPGAGGVAVGNAVTDWRGYALVSGLTPYDINPVNVDMTSLPGNVELDTSGKNVVPTRGALVAVPFRRHTGWRLMLTLARAAGPVPFGATVALVQSAASPLSVTGIVGDDGLVYLSGMPDSGTVTVTWGDDRDSQCQAHYRLPATADDKHLAVLSAECR